MIKSKNKEKDYHYALVEAIRTIDDIQYGKFHPKWARLRRIVDLVLNHDRTIEYAIEKAELEVKITQDFYLVENQGNHHLHYLSTFQTTL